jgi:hypothetical protein
MRDMEYALDERIGNPDLFTGRKEELGGEFGLTRMSLT